MQKILRCHENVSLHGNLEPGICAGLMMRVLICLNSVIPRRNGLQVNENIRRQII